MNEGDFPDGESNEASPAHYTLTEDQLAAVRYDEWMDGFRRARDLMQLGTPTMMPPLPESTHLEELKGLGLSKRVLNMLLRGDWALLTPWCATIGDALDRGSVAMEDISHWGPKATEEITLVLFAAGYVLAPWPRPKSPTRPDAA